MMKDTQEYQEYEEMSKLDWAEYEFTTIEYDYVIHPNAAKAIRAIFKRLHDKVPCE